MHEEANFSMYHFIRNEKNFSWFTAGGRIDGKHDRTTYTI